jgi:putative ABC transport system permease protein
MSLIAVANVFNTVSTNINLRRREFAMLRSVGMTDGDFNRMMIYECVFYGAKALLYGLPTAFAVTYFIYNAMMKGVDVAFNLPWVSVGVSVLCVFLVVFVTTLYSVRSVRRANVIDALREEAI